MSEEGEVAVSKESTKVSAPLLTNVEAGFTNRRPQSIYLNICDHATENTEKFETFENSCNLEFGWDCLLRW